MNVPGVTGAKDVERCGSLRCVVIACYHDLSDVFVVRMQLQMFQMSWVLEMLSSVDRCGM
jgi:hypothetical protein